MDYELLLEIFHSQSDLFEIISSFDLCDAFSSFDELVHGLVSAEFKEDVYIGCIFEMFLVFDDKL